MSSDIGIFQKIRLVITLIYLIILLPLLVAGMAILMIVSLGRLQDFLIRWVGHIFGRSTMAVAGVRMDIRYHGTKPEEPAVFLMNHCSTLDLFIITSLHLPRVRFIAKKELQYNPFFWAIAKMTGQIMIDRKDTRKALQQLNEAYKHIRKNRLSIMFAPEGTRSRTGKIMPFKSGAFHTAVDLGYPVVPIYIEGAYELCPGNSLLTRPGTVTIHIHEPVDTSGWDKKNIREYRDEMRRRYLEWNGEIETEKANTV